MKKGCSGGVKEVEYGMKSRRSRDVEWRVTV
jgi:hypothetical protein